MKTEAGLAFENVSPILRVESLAASIDYYVRVLGFKLDWESPGIIASVSRGRCGIFLCEGDQGNPGGWVWVGVGDVERLFEEYSGKGARIRHPPQMSAHFRLNQRLVIQQGTAPSEYQQCDLVPWTCWIRAVA